MVGARLVLPGPGLDGASLYELFESERVTLSAGVPTVWQGLLTHVQAKGLSSPPCAAPSSAVRPARPAMMETFEAQLRRAGDPCLGHDRAEPGGHRVRAEGGDRRSGRRRRTRGLQARQGRAVFGIDLKIVDGDGAELPWDGRRPAS
jgi:fatty-acyl-CoA synthase